MLNFGVLLALYGFLGSILVNLIMLIRFLIGAQQSEPAIGEIFSFLFLAQLTRDYRDLLIKDGIEPTIFDELLYRINILLQCAFVIGIGVIVIGLFASGQS
jgi:hypothetical protein